MTGIAIRPATLDDVPAMRTILNRIIAIGGSTAYEKPFSEDEVRAHFLTGPGVVSCFAAFDGAGQVAGFQSLEVYGDALPPNVPDIATFARRSPPLPGAGTALFAETRRLAAARGFSGINATIRADNAAGLAYYRKIGFRPHSVTDAVPLQDGTPVNRISMRYDLTA